MRLLKKPKAKSETKTEIKPSQPKAVKKSAEDEIAVVIGTAIYLYTQSSEKQDLKMTIKRTDRPYTPWSQKIYMMRKWPR